MANDFSLDPNCKALWRFESGALTVDSKGGNTLTDNATVGENLVDPVEGSCCADLEKNNSEYFNIADADLDAGFPLKSGDSTKKISVCYWFKPESLASNTNFPHVLKWGGNKNSFLTQTYGPTTFRLLLGYDNGESYETITYTPTPTAFQVGQWYHVAVTYDDSDKSYRIRIWGVTEDRLMCDDVVGTATNNINIEDGDWIIGRWVDFYNYDGCIDELVVFNDILSTDEIDAIRGGSYSYSSPSTTTTTTTTSTTTTTTISTTSSSTTSTTTTSTTTSTSTSITSTSTSTSTTTSTTVSSSTSTSTSTTTITTTTAIPGEAVEGEGELDLAEIDADKIFKAIHVLQMAARFEYSGSKLIYEGYAPSGSSESEEVWLILRRSYFGDLCIQRRPANGQARFKFNWTIRESYSY